MKRRKKTILETSRTAQKRKRRRIFKISLYSFFTLVLIAGISYLSFADFMSVKDIKISGLREVKADSIRNIFKDNTNGRTFVLFSKSNIFLYPKSSIKNEILNKIKRISELDIERKGLSHVVVSIKEREPFAVWCKSNESKDEKDNQDSLKEDLYTPLISLKINNIPLKENCFYLDEDGYIFEPIDINKELSLVRYYNEESNLKIGDYFLDKNTFTKLNKFAFSSADFLRIRVNDAVVVSKDAVLFFDNNSRLILNLDSDLEKTFENLAVFLGEPEFKGDSDTSNTFDLFEYIDLRFGNKILYKLKTVSS